jgi:oligoribonuclease NrnB/cAMP/cGMP phosphodiesterase (DHH superfamily)
MVDFSLSKDEMLRLNELGKLVWIDHHITAIESLSDYSDKIKGLRRVGIGACQLTYEYLFDSNKIPKVVKLLAEYDVWNHSDEDTLPLQSGLFSLPNHPEYNFDLWKYIIFEENNNDVIQNIIDRGKLFLEFEDFKNKSIVQSTMFEAKFEGFKFICANAVGVNAKLFDSVWDDDRYDGMLILSFRKDKWVISMFTPPHKTDKIDLSIIAKKYGGGGHKGACGFSCKTLPQPFFDIINGFKRV